MAFLKALYHYLNMETMPGKPACDMIWEHDEALLSDALVILPEQPALHYSLGLSLFRQGRAAEARAALRTAADSDVAEPRMALAYALILDAQGETEMAIEYLLDSLQRFGNDPGLLSALINLYQRTNRREEADALIMQLQNR